jgi:hypothetical protein
MRPLLSFAAFALLGLAACDRTAAPDLPAAGALPADPSVVTDSIVVADSTLLFFADYAYPQLRDAGPHTEAINRALADSARAVVEAFRPTEPPDPSFVYETTVEGGFDVDRLDGRLFSAVASYYFYTGGAHGNFDFMPLNYDLATGRPFTLADLFQPGAAHLDTLSAYTGRWAPGVAVEYGWTPEDFWAEGWAPETGNFSRFTVGADSLRFYFPPYQIAPYAAGSFEMGVPLDLLRPLLAPDGPAAALQR